MANVNVYVKFYQTFTLATSCLYQPVCNNYQNILYQNILNGSSVMNQDGRIQHVSASRAMKKATAGLF